MLTPCPRCDDPRTEKVSDSPIPGVWEVYRCTHCNYVWRSSEKLSGIHKYDQALVDRVTPWWPQLVRKKRG
jgi:hypothetical protein